MVGSGLWLPLLAIAARSFAAEVIPHRYIVSLDDGAVSVPEDIVEKGMPGAILTNRSCHLLGC